MRNKIYFVGKEFMRRGQLFLFFILGLSVGVGAMASVMGLFVFPGLEGRSVAAPFAAVTQTIDTLRQSTQNTISFNKQFVEIRSILQREHNNEMIDRQSMMDMALIGYMAGLDDPYATYLRPDDLVDFEAALEGGTDLVGIGVRVTNVLGGIRVEEVIAQSPAARAGLLLNDVIVAIDEESILDMTLSEAVQLIRGEPGSVVTLDVVRGEMGSIVTIDVTREELSIEPVRFEIIDDAGQTYAYIRLDAITNNSAQDFVRASNQIIAEYDIAGLMIDVRSNGGGLLSESIEILSCFVPAQTPIVYTSYRAFTNNEIETEAGCGLRGETPVVVMVNEQSASASEIIAGVLQKHRDAIVMGQRTFGKGTIQHMRQLSQGGAIKFTVGERNTVGPDGVMTPINEGIDPDYRIDEDDEGDRRAKAIDRLQQEAAA